MKFSLDCCNAASLGAALVLAAVMPAEAVPGELQKRLDPKLGQNAEENSIVGVAAGVVIDGRNAFSEGYGSTTLDGDFDITDRSVFHWASVSKPFVSVAIMQLVEQGKLSVDDLLTEQLPWFSMADDRYRKITISQLLTHTAGMPDVNDYEWDKPQTDEAALKRWILELAEEELLFAPGEQREYSNIGFEVLGLVIQETAGMPFEEYMRRNIFEPLGMHNSSFIASEIDSALRVTGHEGVLPRRSVDNYPYNRRHAPSSTLNTNIEDMSKFVLAILNNGQLGEATILKSGTIETMWSVAWQSPDDPERTVSLGWNVGRPWGGILAVSHGGHDDGFRSFLYLAPEEKTGIFMVSNDETISTRQFMRTILEIVFPEQAATQVGDP